MKSRLRNRKIFSSVPATWDALTAMYPLRPVHDQIDLDNATEIIDLMAGHDLTADQADYLDALSTLVSAYEDERHPVHVKKIGGIEILRSLMKDRGMNASDLGRLLGIHRSHASKILGGERSLTVEHLQRLAERFKVNPTLFMG